MKKSLVVLIFLVVVSVIAVSGCKDDEKNYSCDEAIDMLYDEDCGLVCNTSGSSIYLNTCQWYNRYQYNTFSENDAEDVCDLIDDEADDEDCSGTFQDLMNCIVRNRNDDCAEDCDDAFDDLMDCMF